MLKWVLVALCLVTSGVSLSRRSIAQKPATDAPTSSATAARPRIAGSSGLGRDQLDANLDRIAADYTAKRAALVGQIQTRTEAEARQTAVRKELLSILDEFPKRTPLHARTLGETQGSGFRIVKVLFESQPNFPVTAVLYLPNGPASSAKHPAILLTPGHYFTGKASDAGMAALFARNGFIVLSYDPIGQGERLQYPDPAHPDRSLAGAATGEHGEASLQPMLLGDTFARYEIWDAIRGVDYLSSLPEVDPKRIGAFGCSGGGTVTALTGALDTRIAAIGVACYITSFDALLPALGPQDAEQSSPRLLSSGLDFADLIEVAAPRRYAVISTYSDMFPFAGALKTVAEARRFYALFDPASAGIPAGAGSDSPPSIPTGPALNADTENDVSPSADLQFITGPGRHAALGPISTQILSFFERTLEPGAGADHAIPALALNNQSADNTGPSTEPPKSAFQVTATGQVATSYPNSETVSSLNRKRGAALLAARRSIPNSDQLARSIRLATGAEAKPGASQSETVSSVSASGPIVLSTQDGSGLQGDIAVPNEPGRHPAVLLLVPDSIRGDNANARANQLRFNALAAAGNVVLAVTPRPSPPGSEEMKSPLLGPFYLLSLRADLVGRTLLGMRVDDVVESMDALTRRPDVDPARISAVASGHMGLVLLHAAVLDSRLRHIAIDHVLTSYRSLLDAPMPVGAPEDVVPGVLLHYDIPDIVRVLGQRVTLTNPLNGSDDLSQTSTPLGSLADLKR